MKVKKAFEILGLAEGSSQEEIKKQYRQLSKKYHPDINKEAGAEQKFKEINEANEVCKSGKSSDIEDRHHQQQWGGGNPFGGGFNPFSRQQQVEVVENVEVNATVSFKESVIGCKREITYDRKIKCQKCNGQGEIQINNGCKKCGGKGRITVNRGNMVMVQTCPDCQGRSDTKDCISCNGNGSLNSNISISINIPPGVSNDDVLRLQSMGNYAGSFMGFAEQHTDAFCHISVVADNELKLIDKDVVSNLNISLLDALKGCQRVVKTIHGDKEIEIPQISKNKEEILIPNCGVPGSGNQRVILNVEYPSDIDTLVASLQIQQSQDNKI